ncbi:MAG: hypothetical protein PHS04_00265 [Tissierellia bacterium]|nr:hypothetical protein [Tissierellia bacterium]
MKIMSEDTIVTSGIISLIIHKSEFKNLREFNKMFTEMTKIIENDSDANKWGWGDSYETAYVKGNYFCIEIKNAPKDALKLLEKYLGKDYKDKSFIVEYWLWDTWK